MLFNPLRSWINSIERRIALRYLNNARKSHLQHFPQLATYSFDFISNCIAVNGRYEDEYLDQLELLIRDLGLGGVALDIGANIGNHSFALSRCFEEVMAFEPNPFVFRLLEVNSALSDNISCFPFGLSDGAGRAEFSFDRCNVGGGSTYGERVSEDSIMFEVDLRPLDSIIELSEKHVGLIKMDVEGQELAVLRGGAGILRRDRPVIVFEILPTDICNGKSRVIEWLRNEGYAQFGFFDHRQSLANRLRLTKRRTALRRLNGLSRRFYQMVVALPGR